MLMLQLRNRMICCDDWVTFQKIMRDLNLFKQLNLTMKLV